MRNEFTTFRKAMTITELLITSVMSGIVIFGLGVVLVHTQRDWENMYERVNGETASDAYTAKRAFESVVRSSSVSLRPPALNINGDFIELYLYENLWSNSIDSYARFYVENGELILICGSLSDPGYKEITGSETGVIKVSSDTRDAFFDASAPLAGSVSQQQSDYTETISSEEAVQQLDEGAFVELYNYPGPTEYSERTKTLYQKRELSAGKLYSSGRTRKQTLAKNVEDVKFSTHGATVRMILKLDDNGRKKTVICSAVSHSG